ncbi:MAG: cobalt transporter subunit CbtA [Verrucomicrobiaceae bacterium]|nr:cobalt transporter subunit CbtA [Verrucomicrobiaceae bacterium]
MLRETLLSAGIAGLFAALVLTVAQLVWISPLILQAETYEDAAEAAPVAHTHNDEAHEHSHEHADEHGVMANVEHEPENAHEHHHDADEWKPDNGWQRISFTLVSNIVMGVGYALVLVGIYTLWQRPRGIGQGLLFGLAGFAVFFAAPGLGLPPELPGTEAAALAARQQWWVGTAIATAIGLGLLFAQKNWLLRAAGVAVLVAPHVIGAPHLATEASLAPETLQTHFRVATTVCNAAFWLLLGAISALASQKFSRQQPFAS